VSKKTKPYAYICGIDEVGRGPIAGPVTVGLVLYKKELAGIFSHIPLRDSKKLSPQKRRLIVKQLQEWKKEGRVFFTTASIRAREIDEIGISKAIKKAIKRVVSRIGFHPNDVYIALDGGLQAPPRFRYQETIIKGDTKHRAISFASIVAKVTRDNHMELRAQDYPEYGLEQHKGYGTKSHYKAVRKHGLSPIHRRSFLKGLA
jgi:ribonuclease HII